MAAFSLAPAIALSPLREGPLIHVKLAAVSYSFFNNDQRNQRVSVEFPGDPRRCDMNLSVFQLHLIDALEDVVDRTRRCVFLFLQSVSI
ncbi:hypothetical protein I6F26_13595 [Ensifer sp. IC3342]|nr:hypothetical protein [Ensifer sp. BRP08]MCA1447613.1 hypothetical protein [Ensifer sp. IC3342]